ncbi:hypothetical protein AB0M22_21605 [Nocardia sp. NPDC051756]|uniref:hypothetical protein n=1 Tax=Nocardia sp. NPDC051756 TaxID=3154751 RepID=UPI00342CE8EF
MTRVPNYEQWWQTIENRQAHLMCFEAIGYARGYCDAAAISSSDAIDFGRAYAVVVASNRSRPSIEGAWRDWQAGRDIDTLSHDVEPPEQCESGSTEP